MPRLLHLVTLALFGALTAAALWPHDYGGLFEPHFRNFGGAQACVDLVIALDLVLAWMWRDTKARGRKIWPWIVLTPAAGAFGPRSTC